MSSRTEKDGISSFFLYEIKVDFSTFEIEPIYQEKEIPNKIVNYGFDEKDNVIVFLNKDMKKERYYIQIVEQDEDN